MSGAVCICNRNRAYGKQKLEEETRETTLTSYEELTAKDVFDEAKAGDAVA